MTLASACLALVALPACMASRAPASEAPAMQAAAPAMAMQGQASPPPPPPPPPPPKGWAPVGPGPGTRSGELGPHIEDALAELRAAERAVEQSLAPVEPPATRPPLPPTSGARVPPPRLTASAPGGVVLPDPAASAPPAEPDPDAASRCVVACNALQSMRRSAALLCELTGRDDTRCSSAEDRVGVSRAKVRASCGACAD
ncbi:MAG: hypothetical protein IT373_09175 [Polyangiaceae bacterium]|nr:hypothetical protein [Polyangiaceae bacterium]